MENMNCDVDIMYGVSEIKAKVTAIGRQIMKDYAGKEITAICILKGAVVFFSDLVRAIDLSVKLDFMIVSSYGNAVSTSGSVRILKDLDHDIKGKHVIVVEDIVDSGTTMYYLLQYLAEKEPASLKLCALLSKPDRRKVDVPIDYCGYEVPDEFIVGYGMDYAEKYRNLPFLGRLKPAVYES